MQDSNIIIGLITFSLVGLFIWIAALENILRRKDFKDQTTKLLWLAIVIGGNFFGATIYFLMNKPKKENLKKSSSNEFLKKIKNMPTGMKIIALLLSLRALLFLYPFRADFIFLKLISSQLLTWYIEPPFSVILNIASIFIFLIFLISLIEKYEFGFKLFYIYSIFILLNKYLKIIFLLFSPLKNLSVVKWNSIKDGDFITKSIPKYNVIIQELPLLLIYTCIMFYLYKNRKYFNKKIKAFQNK